MLSSDHGAEGGIATNWRHEISRPATPFLVVAACSVLAPGSPVTAADGSAGSASRANTAGYEPYVTMGIAAVRSSSTRFVDGADAGHAALYGSRNTFDAGAFDAGFVVDVAAGVRLGSALRAQLEFSVAPTLNYRGQYELPKRGSTSTVRSGTGPLTSLPDRVLRVPGAGALVEPQGIAVHRSRGGGHDVLAERLCSTVSRPGKSARQSSPGSGRRNPLHRHSRWTRSQSQLDADGRGFDSDPRKISTGPRLPIHRCGDDPDAHWRYRHRAIPRGGDPQTNPGPDQRDNRQASNPRVVHDTPVRSLASRVSGVRSSPHDARKCVDTGIRLICHAIARTIPAT